MSQDETHKLFIYVIYHVDAMISLKKKNNIVIWQSYAVICNIVYNNMIEPEIFKG